jgi:uncharacterized DUF497 family protein
VLRSVFVWDEVKNKANQRKHGISFELAQLIFDDPHHLGAPRDAIGKESV